MLKIGLTGGIGSGKSTVANYFSQLQVPIIDADKIVHKLLQPRTNTYKKIVTHFGTSFLTAKKTLNKKKLRNLIFSDKKERWWLEKLLHPAAYTQIQQHLTKIRAPYTIIVVPLLFETKHPPKVDRILVIDCPKKKQITRLTKRDRSSAKQIRDILKIQIDRKTRLKKANDIIYNNASLSALKKAVKFLHNYYLNLAKKHDIMRATD